MGVKSPRSPEASGFRGQTDAIGAPSARLSLIGLRPRRARLRFTWRRNGNNVVREVQEQEHGSGPAKEDRLTCV